ncbi:M48 family peptidase [Rhodophyticola sp. CCM32]|nr:M48 family peptidase [Rhodophyticola sp. CCM32]
MPRPSNDTHILPGDPPVHVALKRSARARRFSLRVSRADGRVSLSLPHWARESDALAFLHDRETWLRRQLAAAPHPNRPEIGGTIPICGVDRQITRGGGRTARLIEGGVQVPDGPRIPPRIRALLQALARERLTRACDRYASDLGRRYGRLTLRDPRSRWGSCSSKGDLMFSWRLIMAPPDVLDYVAAHEVAHLAEMNHSAKFWSVCARLCPGYDAPRAWLKTEGPQLLAWQFDPLPQDPVL